MLVLKRSLKKALRQLNSTTVPFHVILLKFVRMHYKVLVKSRSVQNKALYIHSSGISRGVGIQTRNKAHCYGRIPDPKTYKYRWEKELGTSTHWFQ